MIQLKECLRVPKIHFVTNVGTFCQQPTETTLRTVSSVPMVLPQTHRDLDALSVRAGTIMLGAVVQPVRMVATNAADH